MSITGSSAATYVPQVVNARTRRFVPGMCSQIWLPPARAGVPARPRVYGILAERQHDHAKPVAP